MKKEDKEHIILRWQLMWFRISLIADEFVKFAEKVHMRCDVPEPSQRQPEEFCRLLLKKGGY